MLSALYLDLFFMCMGACMYVCVPHMYGACGTQKELRSSGTRGKDSCEQPCEYWKLNLDPLQGQPEL